MDISVSDQLKILVVDDDELNQRMMQLILTREGHHVHIATDGLDALRAVKDHHFDIILMDLQMPTMDGIEASRRIRNSENNSQSAYIVALTASYFPEKGDELFDAGIDNYIAKPFDVDHLRQMLAYGLDNRKSKNLLTEGPRTDSAVSSVNQSFDIAKGIKMVGGDEETYRELLQDFMEKLPEKIQVIEKCFSEKDMTGLSRAAHNIKGVSSNLGALQLFEYAGRLEMIAGEGYTQSLEDAVRAIKEVSLKFIADASNFLSNIDDKTTAL